MRRRALLFALVVLGLAACTKRAPGPTQRSPQVLNGAGATLPFPLYSKWASEYARVEPTVRVNYQSVGSGAGIREMTDGVVDFGGTDEPMSDAQLGAGPKIVHVPMTIGGVALAYDLPGEGALALTPEVAADVFLGKITRWDDPRLRAIEGQRELPSEPIVVVHRADGSGTTAALTAYLSARSEAFRASVGAGTSPRFPVGVGAKGNEGVAALVKSTPNAIGYVEVAYAVASNLPVARVRNHAGKFVAPTLDALDRAAASVSADAGDVRSARLFDADDPAAYPLATVSFVLVPEEARDRARGEAVAKFLWWAVHDGQRFAPALDYAALPPPLVARAEEALRSLRSGGAPLLPGG